MSEIVPVVFTIDNKFVTPAYIAIQSLLKNAEEGTLYNVLLLGDKVSKKNINMLKKLFINNRHTFEYIEVSNLSMRMGKVSYIWPRIIYCRLFLCDILLNYENVIYSDVDVLFLGDLSSVYKQCVAANNEEQPFGGGYEIAAVPAELNNSEMCMHTFFEENIHEKMYWSGFCWMNLEYMRQNNWHDRCIDTSEKFARKLKMGDLEIINLTAGKIYDLPMRYCYMQSLYDNKNYKDGEDYVWLSRLYSDNIFQEEKENAVIVHYAGQMGKPWMRRNVPDYYMPYLKKIPWSLRYQNMGNWLFADGRKSIRWLYRHTLKKWRGRASNEQRN